MGRVYGFEKKELRKLIKFLSLTRRIYILLGLLGLLTFSKIDFISILLDSNRSKGRIKLKEKSNSKVEESS